MKLNPLNHMSSLLGKILLALLTSTVLALLLVSIIQRSGFKQGLQEFLQQQEQTQLSNLVPELEQWYRERGSWEALRGSNRQWLRLLARARPEGITPPEAALLDSAPSPSLDAEPALSEGPRETTRNRAADRWDWQARVREDAATNRRQHDRKPPDELRRLWRRMFLLEENLGWVAGAPATRTDTRGLQAVNVDGLTVGWVGFVPAGQPAAPEARRFLNFQRNTLLVSAGIALLAATWLGFLLALHLTRPVVALRDSVKRLTAGDYSARTEPRGEDEIASLARHINRLAETLQANESARRRWTADMAHELRTPVAIIQAEIEAARDGVRTDLNKTLDSLHEEVSHLSALVDDLQALALADAGALNLQLADLDLTALLRQVVDSFEDRLRQSGLHAEVSAPEPVRVLADAQRIRQLLLNLLENSRRYTDPGGRIHISLRQQETGAELRIEDTAPGLQPAQIKRLFERFYRADSSRTRAGGGSGLGLSICREIVLAHGGTIGAEASKLGGLAIVVRLPTEI